MGLADFLKKHPVFTRSELEEFVKEHYSGHPGTLEQLIHYHLARENIGQVKRGLFYVVERGYTAQDCPVDIMLVTGKMRADAVLAYHTALDLYGHAHSVYNRLYFLTKRSKNTETVQFRNYEIKPVQVPKALLKKGKEQMEVKKYDRSGLEIFVTSRERTLVDMIDRPDLSGGWEEIWRSTEGFGFLKMKELVEYTLALDNQTTTAKVGFFLEQYREEYGVEAKYLKQLEKHSPAQPRYMDKSFKKATMISRWNLIVPDYILNQEWKEF